MCARVFYAYIFAAIDKILEDNFYNDYREKEREKENFLSYFLFLRYLNGTRVDARHFVKFFA